MQENTTDDKLALKKVVKGLYIELIIKTRPFWGTPLVICLAFLVPYLFKYFNADFWNPDFHLRASGFILQFLFVIVVLIDICEIMKFFDRPSPMQSFKKWWGNIIRLIYRKTFPASYSAGTIRGGGSLSGITESKRTGLELVERVELLEKELQDHMKQTNEKFQKVKDDTKELEKKLKIEKRQREQDFKTHKGLLERISTKGLKREVVALLWLVAGLLFSIFSSELASILNWL